MAEQIIYPGKLPVTESGTGSNFSGLLQERDVDGDGVLKYEPINPIIFYEKSISSDLYLPPGVADDDDVLKPRFRIPEIEKKLDNPIEIIEEGGAATNLATGEIKNVTVDSKYTELIVSVFTPSSTNKKIGVGGLGKDQSGNPVGVIPYTQKKGLSIDSGVNGNTWKLEPIGNTCELHIKNLDSDSFDVVVSVIGKK